MPEQQRFTGFSSSLELESSEEQSPEDESDCQIAANIRRHLANRARSPWVHQQSKLPVPDESRGFSNKAHGTDE